MQVSLTIISNRWLLSFPLKIIFWLKTFWLQSGWRALADRRHYRRSDQDDGLSHEAWKGVSNFILFSSLLLINLTWSWPSSSSSSPSPQCQGGDPHYPSPHLHKVVMANCARITARDVLATNGIVHVVDKVNITGSVFVIIFLSSVSLSSLLWSLFYLHHSQPPAQMIQPATNSLGHILNNDFGFAKFSKALKASGICGSFCRK